MMIEWWLYVPCAVSLSPLGQTLLPEVEWGETRGGRLGAGDAGCMRGRHRSTQSVCDATTPTPGRVTQLL